MAAVYNKSQMAAVTCGLTGQPINLIQASAWPGKSWLCWARCDASAWAVGALHLTPSASH